jgi:hypothetical protein
MTISRYPEASFSKVPRGAKSLHENSIAYLDIKCVLRYQALNSGIPLGPCRIEEVGFDYTAFLPGLLEVDQQALDAIRWRKSA